MSDKVTRVFVCTECTGDDSPCIYTVVKGSSEDSKPDYCPHKGSAKWMELRTKEEARDE